MGDDKKQKTLFLDDAAPPAAPPAASNQSTVMLDAPNVAPARQMVVPTMMKEPPRQNLPPMAKPQPPSTAARWIAGPIIAAIVAAGTVAVAGRLLPRHAKGQVAAKPQGKLRLNTSPPGASITVDGKRLPRFTPVVIEGDIGATLKLTFVMDGYQPHEAEVYVAEGEHPFNVTLKPSAPPPAPAPAAPEAAPAPKHEHHGGPAKEPVGEATLSVLVRPWAIVFVDKQRLKQTPVQGYKLPSGKHVIELVNESMGRREKIEVSLKPGDDQDIRRDWDK